MKKYFIVVKGLFNKSTNGTPVTFRTVEERDFLDNIKVLNAMLDSGEITSYEVKKDSECTCFTCDDDCEIIKSGLGYHGA